MFTLKLEFLKYAPPIGLGVGCYPRQGLAKITESKVDHKICRRRQKKGGAGNGTRRRDKEASRKAPPPPGPNPPRPRPYRAAPVGIGGWISDLGLAPPRDEPIASASTPRPAGSRPSQSGGRGGGGRRPRRGVVRRAREPWRCSEAASPSGRRGGGGPPPRPCPLRRA
jgi:hypothetical protein